MSATTLSIGSSSGGAGRSQLDIIATLIFNASAEAISYQLSNAYSPVYVQPVNLAAGNNVVTIPVAPQVPGGVIIVPQAEATYRATLKGVAGDTGIVLNTNAPAFIPFHTAPAANFVLSWGGKGYNGVAVVADPATDKITHAAHGMVAGDRVKFNGTTMPGGLTTETWYYIVNPAAGDYQLAATLGGSVIDITSAGVAVTVTTADQFRLTWV